MSFLKFLGGLFLFIILCIVIFGGITYYFVSSEHNSFCQVVHPPNSYERSILYPSIKTNTMNLQEGFLECCRKVYVNYTVVYDCKIFAYEV